MLRDIEQAAQALFSMTGKIGQYLRENDWLMSIKQRTGIPGGACEFDLPSYHYWLHRPSEERTGQLAAWTGPLHPLRDGTAIILRILRESGKPQALSAPQGTFQQMLGGKTAQMLRLRLDPTSPCVPEISANKYVLNIRFMAQNGDRRIAAAAHRRLGRRLRARRFAICKNGSLPALRRAGEHSAPRTSGGPFCSERCRMIDLGEWAAETTACPGPDHSSRTSPKPPES